MGLRDIVNQRKAERPKTLAELRAAKKGAPVVAKDNGKPKTLAEIRRQRKASKHDFHRGGVRYHNARQTDGGWWEIDVSNGDMTYTMHNRHGSWLHNVGSAGRMAEPVQVALALGTDVSQMAMGQALTHRLQLELKDRK